MERQSNIEFLKIVVSLGKQDHKDNSKMGHLNSHDIFSFHIFSADSLHRVFQKHLLLLFFPSQIDVCVLST